LRRAPFLVHELGAHQYEEALACLTNLRTVGLSYLLFRYSFTIRIGELGSSPGQTLLKRTVKKWPGGRRKGLRILLYTKYSLKLRQTNLFDYRGNV
jgi:hypothetical protein